jgi:hypothetical protein
MAFLHPSQSQRPRAKQAASRTRVSCAGNPSRGFGIAQIFQFGV